MGSTPFRASGVRPGEWYGDMAAWMRDNAEDNSEQLTRLQRNLRSARKQELTPRQNQMLELYFDRRMNMVEIAKELGSIHPLSPARSAEQKPACIGVCATDCERKTNYPLWFFFDSPIIIKTDYA